MSYLENFLFSGSEVRKPVKALSGGERTRVALAKLLRQETSLLLLDEPTNDLDLDTLAALEGLLLEHDITAIVVTHDRWFLDRIATSILWFEGDARVTRLAGNYTNVRAFREAAAAQPERGSQRRGSGQHQGGEHQCTRAESGQEGGLSYKEQKELDQIEGLIAQADAQGRASSTRCSPTRASTRRAPRRCRSWSPSAIASARESERLMNRWAELEEKRG